eukprot:jgi/Botrbrau1/8077/Bobra.0230s0004.1
MYFCDNFTKERPGSVSQRLTHTRYLAFGASRNTISNGPVSLISTKQPSVIFSSSRRREASKSRNPGLSDRDLMLSILTDLPQSVARIKRCRRFWHPSNLSIPDIAYHRIFPAGAAGSLIIPQGRRFLSPNVLR